MTRWRGRKVVDPSGDRLGTVQEMFVAPDGDEPRWALVGGIFGRSAFVPLTGVDTESEVLEIPYYRDVVRRAPEVGSAEGLSAEDEVTLYRHYGIDPPTDATTALEVVRFEERLDVHLVSEPVERVVVRKRVVTEYETRQVEVRREELVVEREALDAGAGPGVEGVEIGEDVIEVTLYREVPVVGTRVVPVERVRLVKDVVTESVDVSGDVRREAVEVESTES